MRFALEVNGALRNVDVAPGTNLLTVLRDDLDLTGTKAGCGNGGCGACAVLIGNQSQFSCKITVEEVGDRPVVTVEGLARGKELSRVQEAFLAEDAMQCGACTSGMLIEATALLSRSPHPERQEVREAMSGHLCRCGVYGRIEAAVARAAK